MGTDVVTLPDRIEAGSVVLRRERPADADAIARAVAESLDHLRPWMPWATVEAATAGAQRDRLAAAAVRWDSGTDFGFLILSRGEDTLHGIVGLHRRIGPGAVEIGYWLRPSSTGYGYVTAAVTALIAAVFAVPQLSRVEIHCDEANAASAAVPRRLGFRLDRVENRDIAAPGECGRHMVWVLERR